MDDYGILYFLTTKDRELEKSTLEIHGSLLCRSLSSLKKSMPNIKTALFTNIESVDWNRKGFDIVKYKYEPQDVWTYKYDCLLETPFKKTIHMDCDTYVCDQFYEVFEMLDGVDFAAPFSPWYFTKKQFNIPRSFPELAGGFMAYNSSRKAFDMLEFTRNLVIHRSSGCDEPYLRIALYKKRIKFCILPWEYNCVFMLPGFVMDRVKVLHGKKKNIEPVAKSMIVDGPKIFTGEKLIYCERIGRKKYTMGLIENRGYEENDK